MKIEKNNPNNIACDMIQQKDGRYVMIDTCYVPMDKRYETIIVYCSNRGNVRKADWGRELGMMWYHDKDEALKGHNEAVDKYENK